MGHRQTDPKLRKRIREGKLRKRDVARRLAELAFGRVNDCVRLVLGEPCDLDTLDLSLLSEVRRNDKGTVEVRLIDRLQVLQQLEAMTEGEQTELDAFLQSLQEGEKA